MDELAKTKPTLTYGSGSKPAPVEFIPAHVAFDKKVKQVIHILLIDTVSLYRCCVSLPTSNKQFTSHPMSTIVSEMSKFITILKMTQYQ